MTTIATLLGGIGLFLLGMSMMTDGLKLAGGKALRTILERWTRSAFRGLLAGALITGVVQSSSAVTVATVGFVNAGLLTLSQAVWVVFGSNIGSTMTGWLVAAVGMKIDVGALALPLLGAGMILRLAARGHVARAGLGQALAGFGAFFLGVGVLQEGFSGLTPLLAGLALEESGPLAVIAFAGLGALLTVLTQSSSAAIAITLTASAGAGVPFLLAGAAVVGANIGTTSTALFATIGATAPAKRVALAHIGFNLVTGFAALVALPLLLDAASVIAGAIGAAGDETTGLAVFHTLFNCLGVALVAPFAARGVRYLETRYRSPAETAGVPYHLDPNLAGLPALALRSLVLEVERMTTLCFDLAAARIAGARGYEEKRDGALRLGVAIRDFIGKMNAQPLPEEVVEALPDLIRAVQHLEELIVLAGDIDPAFAPPILDPADRKWRALREALDAILSAPAETAALSPLAAANDEAYEGLKAELLAAAARGALPVARMEAALLQARLRRRGGETALKALRRLAPLRANGGEIPPGSPPPATAETAAPL